MPDGDQFYVPVSPHATGLWIGIDVTINASVTIFMVLDCGSPRSAISPGLSQDLQRQGLLHATADPRSYRLTNLTADANPLPDLIVRELSRLTRLKIDGLLGLDFFGSFELTCFRLSTSQPLLEYLPTATE